MGPTPGPTGEPGIAGVARDEGLRGGLQARALTRTANLRRWDDTQRGLAAATDVESAGAA
ncbi:hypothetical protein WMF37_40500 [Sorangium sp. So ce291]|uniref:hypothetical protein n=1 Tax=Sorangium sp. So ce291 TaxID=3133294 RepID=UPI003F5FA7FC